MQEVWSSTLHGSTIFPALWFLPPCLVGRHPGPDATLDIEVPHKGNHALLCPLTPKTLRLIHAEAIEKMGPAVMLISSRQSCQVETQAPPWDRNGSRQFLMRKRFYSKS